LPRPRIVRNPRFIGFEVEAEVYEALRRIAFERGTSISSVARELLMRAAEQLKLSGGPPAQAGAGDPPSIDPVIKMDLEEFGEELSKLESALTNIESEVARNPHLTKPIANPLLESIRQSLLSSLSNIEDKLKKLRSKYYNLRRVAKNNGDLDKLAEKLYYLRKRIKDVRKQLVETAKR
jgi:type II secretory pathway component PulF